MRWKGDLQRTQEIVASGPQPVQPSEHPSKLLIGAGITAGIAASGFIPVGRGKRMWDYYLSALRSVETGSPGAVLRTFRLSEMLSPLESWKSMTIAPHLIGSGGVYGKYLRKTLGDIPEGVSIRGFGSVMGEVRARDNRLVGYALNAASGTHRGEAIADYYARISGIKVPEGLSMSEGALFAEWQSFHRKTGISFQDWKDLPENRVRQPRVALISRLRGKVKIFGKDVQLSTKASKRLARAELVTNYLRAKTAATVGRLNNLLQKPFEIPVLGKALEKIPFIKSMAIEPGTATQMWGRYVKKGIAAGLVWKGLEYYDYLRANNQPASVAAGTLGGAALGGLLLKKGITPFGVRGAITGAAAGLYSAISPRFEHGLFHGAASFVTDMNLTRARFSDFVGLTDQLQSQEQITPGLLGPGAALAAIGAGAMIAGVTSYGAMAAEAAGIRLERQVPYHEIVDQLRIERKKKFADKWAAGIGKRLRRVPFIGKHLAAIKSPMAAGALAGLGVWAAVSSTAALLSGNVLAAIPGAGLLGTTDTEEQLQKWYSGEEEVPIRKGRWWEFGRSTAYEGGRIQYYRPHFMARLKSRAFQKGLWGTEEERWKYDPALHPLKAIFGPDEWKYAYELKHQYDRPAPLTGTYFEDVPFVGPLLAGTVGKLLKPRKLVRADEWVLGQDRLKHHPGRPESEPAYELGGLPPGSPVLPDTPSQLFNELMYRRREAVGLVGFAEGAIQKAITGREEFAANQQTIATMGRETGSEYWLWKHLNLGGGFFTTEAVRRFIPRTRSYLDRYNPLKADLPSWMPEDYFLDYEYGNPWDKIPEAEIRLPGAGLAALHPELEGVDPEAYPLAWRTKILGDVAMWSKEYKRVMKQAWSQRHKMAASHRQMVETTKRQVKAKKIRREFDEYKFRESELERRQVTVKEVISPREIITEEFGGMRVVLQGVGATKNMEESMNAARERLEGKQVELAMSSLESRRYYGEGRMRAVAMLGDIDYGREMAEAGYTEESELEKEFRQLRYGKGEGLAGDIGELYSRAILTPVEQLTPMSFPSKFYRHRSALEEYIATEAIGTGNAFWDRPIENFLRPAKEMGEYKLGEREIPEETVTRRAVIEYFDILKYVKEQKLAKKALDDREYSEYAKRLREAKKTMFGVNPFANPANVMMTLPRRERDFFAAFVDAKTEEDREQILSLVPREEQRIYLSQWARQEAAAIKAKKDANIATKEDDATLSRIVTAVRSEGMTHDEALEQLWMQETGGEVPFAEWLRSKKLEQFFLTRSLPGPDWIGWHPSVDLQDIEVKYVQNEGLDHHDFDLWGDRVKSLARKPYIDEVAINALTSVDDLTASLQEESEMIQNAKAMGAFMGSDDSDIMVSRVGANIGSQFDMDVRDGRRSMLINAYDKMGAKTLKDY